MYRVSAVWGTGYTLIQAHRSAEVAAGNPCRGKSLIVVTPTAVSHRRAGLKLALLAFAQFIIAVDYNIVYVALPDIGREVGFSAQSLQWVVSAYAVGFGGFLLFGGRAVDRIGPRRIFILGLALFGLASLAGGFATTPEVLVAARAVQGLGAALLTPATLALIAIGFEEGPARNRAIGVWGAAGSGGLAAGALLGGVLTNAWGWEWVLFVMVPMALVAAAAAPALLSKDTPHAAGQRHGFDVPGAVLATIGSSLLVFGLVSGPDAGWGSLRSAGALVAGAVILGVFLLVEGRSRDPLVPLRLFGNRSLTTAMLVILVFQSSLGGAYYLFTTHLQNVLGYSALSAGLAFVPLTLISMTSSFKLAGAMLGRWGVRTTLFAGMLINGVGLGVLAIGMTADGSFWTVFPGLVLWGIGGGITFPAMFVAAGSGVVPQEQGVASALATTSQQIGGAIGLAALLAVAAAAMTGGGATPAGLADGLRTAGWVAAIATIAGAFLALAIKPPAAPAAVPSEAAAAPSVSDVDGSVVEVNGVRSGSTSHSGKG